jgi:hypothetical protein
MSVTFFEVDFDCRESFGLGLEKHKLAYSVESGRRTTIDCCMVTCSTIATDVKEGDILVRVNDTRLINNHFNPPGHFESCVKSLADAKKSVATIQFLRTSATHEALLNKSDITIINFTRAEGSMIYYEDKEKEVNEKDKKKERDRIFAIEKEVEKTRLLQQNEAERKLLEFQRARDMEYREIDRLRSIEEAKKRAIEDAERSRILEEQRQLEAHAAKVMAERSRKLAEEQDRLRFELVPSLTHIFQHLFHGESSLGLDIVPRQIKCVLASGEKTSIDCCVVTDSALTANVIAGDIITKINGHPIAVRSKRADGVAPDFLGTSLGVISTATTPRMLEFMRPAGSTPACPAGLNPHLIIRISPAEEAYLCLQRGNYRTETIINEPQYQNGQYQNGTGLVSRQSQSISEYQNGQYQIGQHQGLMSRPSQSISDDPRMQMMSDEEIDRRVMAKMAQFDLSAFDSIAQMEDNGNLTEEEEINRRVAVESKKFLREEMTRLEGERLKKLAEQMAAEQAEILAQRLLVAEEMRRAEELNRKAIAEAKERELQAIKAGEEIRRLLEEEVRIRVDEEMSKIQDEKARRLEELEQQIKETAELLAIEDARIAEVEKIAEAQRIIDEIEAERVAAENAIQQQIDDEVDKRVALEARRITEEKRLEYMQHLAVLEDKLIKEEALKKLADEERERKEAEDRLELAERNKFLEAEKKKMKLLENQAIFDEANKRNPFTASTYSIVFPGREPIGLSLAPINVTYTDAAGRLFTIDCCMVLSSALTDDMQVGDILMSVNNTPLLMNRSNTFQTSSDEHFKSVMDAVTKASVPRTIRYYRLPDAMYAAGGLSMNASFTDALLLLSE